MSPSRPCCPSLPGPLTACLPATLGTDAPKYGNGDFAPGIKYGDWGKWKCGHNLLLAHAKAVKLFRDKYKSKNDGKIGMALWSEWSEPWSGSAGGVSCAVLCWDARSSRLSKLHPPGQLW